MKKIAVIGKNSFMTSYFNSVVDRDKYEMILFSVREKATDYYLDLEQYKENDFSCFKQFDFVLFLAAISSPDRCEEEWDYCYKVNVMGTNYCIERILNQGCKVLFFSSDAVYGLDIGVPFEETMQPNPISSYGKMKYEVECNFLREDRFKAIRLSYVFSYYDKFTQYYLSSIKENKIAEIYHPFYRNIIWIEDLKAAIFNLLEKWNEYPFPIINMGGNQLISRVELVDMINRYLTYKKDYKIISMPETWNQIRPNITEMKCKIAQTIIPNYKENFYKKVQLELEKYRKEKIR